MLLILRRYFYPNIFTVAISTLVTLILLANRNADCNKCLSSSYSASLGRRHNCLSSRAMIESILRPRVLIVTSDNRPLDYSSSRLFIQKSTIINYQYALIHGYDYKYFVVDYKQNKRTSSKNAASCYNSALKQERAGPWSKLQVLWYVYSQLSTKYDWFLYLDSDAVIVNQSVSLYDYMEYVSYIVSRDRGCHFLLHPKCDIVFMHNKPFTLTFPNSGVFLFRKADPIQNPFDTMTAKLLQLWWHHNRSDKNFVHDYEQSSLWNILYQHDFYKNISLNDSNSNLYKVSRRLQLSQHTSIMDDSSFDFHNSAQFIEHIGSNRKTRLSDMNQALKRLSINASLAKFLYETVRTKHLRKIDTSKDRIPPIKFTSNF